MYSSKIPPTSIVSLSKLGRVSFPSENAPAPENPLVILQYGLHLTHFPTLLTGQVLCSTRFPWSIKRIFYFYLDQVR